jgi:hypothetical protein
MAEPRAYTCVNLNVHVCPPLRPRDWVRDAAGNRGQTLGAAVE